MMAAHGHVDGLNNEEICGWIADPSDFDASCGVHVTDKHSGEVLTFLPHVFRPDVVKHLRHVDAFGFAISTDHLPSHWTRVTISNAAGEPLVGGDTLDLGPRSMRKPEAFSPQIFLHIQKSSGTSIRTALQTKLPNSRQCAIYGHDLGVTIDHLSRMEVYQKNAFKLIMGHMYYGVHTLLDCQCKYITVLRHPVSRVISNFLHHKRINTEIKGISLHTAANEGLLEEFDNYQLRVLTGSGTSQVPLGEMGKPEVELALHNLENHFSLIGFIDKNTKLILMQRFLGMIESILGICCLNLPRMNTRGSDRLSRNAPLNIAAIKYNNRFDRMLYHEAKRLFLQ